MELMTLAIVAAFAPLAGAALAGFLGWKLGRAFAHTVTIASVAISLVASLRAAEGGGGGRTRSAARSTPGSRATAGRIHVGFLVDRLTVVMMVVVTFVSLMVHVYTIGYMADDPGYQRFFAYISLFTFSMLMLVMANNFLQLFFGWEAVGLVSYLLIGFWFKRPTAIYANLKAFLVNRVGDFGFLLGIGFVFAVFGTLDYAAVFAKAPALAHTRDRAHPGRALGAGHRHLHRALHRRHGQERAVPAARVAAGLDGGPHAHLRADPRGHDGDGGHLHGGAHVAALRAVAGGAVVRDRDRRHHRVLHGARRHRAVRHQARGGLLDALAAGLHDDGAGRRGLPGGDLPPHDARLLQGGAVPGRGLGDHRAAPRAGHAQDGRAAQVHAHHLPHGAHRRAGQRGPAALRGLLLQGFDHRGAAPVADAGRRVRLRAGARGRVRGRLLLLPPRLLRLPRQGALPRGRTATARRTTATRSRGTRTSTARRTSRPGS